MNKAWAATADADVSEECFSGGEAANVCITLHTRTSAPLVESVTLTHIAGV